MIPGGDVTLTCGLTNHLKLTNRCHMTARSNVSPIIRSQENDVVSVTKAIVKTEVTENTIIIICRV